MSKKDYIALARALAVERPHPVHWETAYKQWKVDVLAVSGVLAEDNPRFDPRKFIEACESLEGRDV